ncbi:uncharacterized protein LOC143475246 isoform X1 [Brachyhypopomus gauderio]|uniref:uncharacterized protein LOC143475246 isoform X1 n=1 Tax=Brachyhypopomus gauderio TaxID=698409 RepID=UPI004041327C
MMSHTGSRAILIQGLYLWLVVSACGCTAFLQVSPELQDTSVANQLKEHLNYAEQVNKNNETSKHLNATNFKAAVESNFGSGTIVAAVLLSVFSVALIVMVVRFRVFHRFLGGYRDALLPEEDTASQFSHIGTIAEHFPQTSLSNREAYARGHDDDDDGFIEDNYIEASKRYATEEEEEQEEESDDDLDIHFSID